MILARHSVGRYRRRALRLLAVAQELSAKAMARARPSPRKPARRPAPITVSDTRGGLTGLTVVITGATRGVGRAIAEGFAAEGARVALIARDRQTAETEASAIGPQAIGLAADVTDPAAVAAAFDTIQTAFGRIDLFINNAGIAGPVDTAAWNLPGDQFDAVMKVNVTGAFVAAAEALRRMRDQGTGRIVNVSSGAVDRAVPGMTAYAASKHALEGLTRQLAADANGTGVTVCSLRLGSLRTAMTEAAFGTVKASLLPEPESVVPAFRDLALAPAALVNGRSFAAWRLLADPQAELYAPTPMAVAKPFAYPSYTHNGRKVERDDPDFRVYDRAENQFGPSPRVAEALTEALARRPMQVYPDEAHGRLRARLAEVYDLSPEHFAIGNGSWELLDRLLEIFTEPGDEVVCGRPGWFGFTMLCGKRGLNPVRIPMRQRDGRLDYDLDAIAAAVTPTTRLVYLISPSNPEGIVLRRAATIAFLDALPPGLPVLFDEAYFEFCNDPEAISARELLDRRDRPIFGLRTFSKFHALASMRVGYAYARPEFTDLLNRGERIFNISHLSEIAAVAALDDTAHQTHMHAGTIAERSRIEARIDELGLDHIPSQAPYILVELPGPLSEVVARFAEAGIYLGEKAFYKNKYILFPVSVPADNDRNLEILAGCLVRSN